MDYLKPCQYSTRLIERLKSLDTRGVLDFDLIHKAIYWAKKYHGNQLRKSGEPYYTHPLEVAYMISEYKLKTDVIVTSILHDIVEDTEVTAGMIVDAFSWRIAEMVDRLTRVRPDGSKLSVKEILDNAYKKEDKEVMLVKLMDRLHNMITLSSMSEEKQQETIKETLEVVFAIVYIIDSKILEEKLAILCNNIDKSISLDCYNFLTEKNYTFQLPSLDLKND